MSHEDVEAVGVTATLRTQVEDVVCWLVGEIAPDWAGPARPDQWLVADLGYYSLLVIELAFALEELFQLGSVSAEDAPPVSTVLDLQEYLFEKIRSGEAGVPDMTDVETFLRSR